MTVAVTGASGHLGRLVIQKLKERTLGETIVAVARTPAKAADLDVEVRHADYARPETLRPALQGVDTLLLISATDLGQRVRQHGNVIDAAKQAGLGRIVYTSVLHADTSPLSLAPEHRDTEAALKASGLRFTILRDGWYVENYGGSINGALASGVLIGSAGEGRISSATRDDYAEAAALVLTSEGHDGRTYELAGDDAHTLSHLAAELASQTGREIRYENLPRDAYAAALTGFGFPEVVAHAFAGWDVDASRGALFDDGRQLSTLIGRPTTSLSASVSRALG